MRVTPIWEARLVPALRAVSLVSGLFCLVMAALLVISALRMQAADPLASPALTALKQRLASSPSDEPLAAQIRALDLLARTAYFSSRSQIDSGAILLAVAFALFVASLRFAELLTRRIADPTTQAPAALSRTFAGARRALLVSGAALTVVVCLSAVLVRRDLRADFRSVVNSLGLGDYPSEGERERNWPGFRGPLAGRAPASATGAQALGAESLAVLWRAAIDLPGRSSPAAWGDRVYLTGGTAEAQEIYCLEAADGALAWTRSVKELLGRAAAMPDVSADTGWAAPTPACDGKRVFAMFAGGLLFCLDVNGKLLWYKDFGTPDNPYGLASSPVPYRDELIVQYDQANMSLVVALDVSDGGILWRHSRKLGPSWATPLVVEQDATRALIVVGNPTVEALDPDTGRALWGLDCMGGDPAPSPAWAGGMVFAVSNIAPVAAIARGSVVWSYDDDLPDTSSPLATEERLYLASSSGTVSAIELATGRLEWKQRLEVQIASSPILIGGTVFLADRQGVLHRFADAPQYRPLADVVIGGPVWATPAFHEGKLFVRAGGELVCLGGAR
jgi:outer membrane protein assembly factor BamB